MDVKDLIKMACGPDMSISKFAEKISKNGYNVSASTLYRLSSGDIKVPVSDELLHAIVKNAADESGVTFSMLKDAFTELLNNQQNPGVRMRNLQTEAVKSARRLIANNLLMSGFLKVQKIGLGSISTPANQISKLFNFAFKVEKDSDSQVMLFKVVNSDILGINYESKIDNFVGRLLRTQDRNPVWWYYLTIYRSIRSESNNIASGINDFICASIGDSLRYGSDLPLNIGILFLTDLGDGHISTNEYVFGSGQQIAPLSSIALGDDLFSDYTTDDYLITGSSQMEDFEF